MWPGHTTGEYVQHPPKPAGSPCGISVNQVSTSDPTVSCSGISWEDELSGAEGSGGRAAPAAVLQLSQPWDTGNGVCYFETSAPVSEMMCVCVVMCTFVLISSGIVLCWIQEWTSASSCLCSWLNQGWSGWSTRSFSRSSANTSFWSLDRQDTKQSNNIKKQQMKTKLSHLKMWLSNHAEVYHPKKIKHQLSNKSDPNLEWQEASAKYLEKNKTKLL